MVVAVVELIGWFGRLELIGLLEVLSKALLKLVL
jgi:hypothetical protein